MGRRAIALLVGLTVCGLVVRAAAGDGFARTDATDELALARAAAGEGDVALAQRLAVGAPRYEALLAIRASAHARAPELLIPALAALACGRDPALAPEAALGLRKLELSPAGLAERETVRGDLERARQALACADRKPLPRADIVSALHQLSAQLELLLK
jgi:hypothetical protein